MNELKLTKNNLSSFDAPYGKKIGIVAATTSGFKAAYKGYRKVSHIVVTFPKRDYYELVNTSSGIEKLGITVNPLQDAGYSFVGGLLSVKDDTNEGYVRIPFDTSDDRNHVQNIGETFIIDVDGNKYVYSDDYFTPSYIKNQKEGSGREAQLKISVKFRTYKLDNIIKINVNGMTYINEELNKLIGDK